MRVIDSHVHFWDPAAIRYPWLESVPDIERAFLPHDYPAFTTGDADAVIFVEANCHPAESQRELAFVERLARLEPRIKGIIAYVNIVDAGALATALDLLHLKPAVVGVRMNIQGEPTGFATSDAFVRGVQEVGRRGYVFDLCTTADQLREATDLVHECPDVIFVLDHCGKPSIRSSEFERWAEDIAHLAVHANVACKLSGLLTLADVHQRTYDVLLPYFEQVLRAFGALRVLYGSDWPVLTNAGGLSAWRTCTDRFTATWSADDRQKFYASNAQRIYGISL